LKNVDGKNITIGLALSGGGSRAIAFHLGCLKALNENGLLKYIDTISSVSGGSVISALYSYSDDSFEEFQERTKVLLEQGLQSGMFLTTFTSWLGILILINSLLFFIVEILNVLIALLFKILSFLPFFHFKPKFLISIPRNFNRTSLLEYFMDRKYFKGKKVTAPVRNNLNVIINACELRTGTAFRFGNMESGCWRYGKVKDNDVSLSTAVVASAAYPVLLPAIDRTWQILDREGKTKRTRLFLTDGGVYENLGVSCLEPSKNPKFSYNAFPSDFIICCNAGHGQFAKDNYPRWWAPRMIRAFNTVFKNLLNGYADKLHIYKSTKKIHGFIYSYLGQIDNKLEFKINDLIPRTAVIDYPTDFSKIPKEKMEIIIERGRQLTKNLIEFYYKELI